MSLPYFPMFPSDFEAKTSHLTLAEDGAYNRLLRICWMTPGCTIPADEAWIMRRVRGCSDEDKEAVRSVLAEYFTIENGRYSNAKLMQIWRDTNEAHEKRKNAGSKGGKAKSLKNNNSASSNAVAKLKQPEPEPNKEKDISNDISKKANAFPSNEAMRQFVLMWNEFADSHDLAKVKDLTSARRSSLRQRMIKAGSLKDLIAILISTAEMPHLMGENGRGWKMDFDFFIRESAFTKICEGVYQRRSPSKPQEKSLAEMAAEAWSTPQTDGRTQDENEGPIFDGTVLMVSGSAK